MLDDVTRDVRHGLRMLRRSPGFTTVAVLTLALGIGANTAIFSIVNGVILRPLGYPQPERLMFLSTQFPLLGFTEFWVSPPEYMEFRELNRSFSSVGAFTTGEVNLIAGDRPFRVRSASVDEHLLNALGVQAAHGRLFAKGETDVTGPPPAPGQPAPPPPPIVDSVARIVADRIRRTPDSRADGRRNKVSRREVIGVMPPGADVMDNRTEIWMPLGLNPGNRQNRGSHFLYLIGRLRDGVTPRSAGIELDALIRNWGERTGVKNHLFTPLTKEGGHILQMAPLRGRSPWRGRSGDLGAASGRGLRAAHRVRQSCQPAFGSRRSAPSRICRANGARSRPRTAASAVHDRGCAVVAGRRRVRLVAGATRRAGAARRLSDQSAADERGGCRFARAALYPRRVHGDRRDLRACTADAYPHEKHGDRAQGRRRTRGNPIRTPSHSPRARHG